MAASIHHTAVVSPGAELGEDVVIGPYVVIGPGVWVGDRTTIGPQVHVDGRTRIGSDNTIVGQASLGGPPQDLSYKGEATWLDIGDRNTIREFVTINRGTVKGGGVTQIGNDCLLMACCHVAHDCEISDGVILGNNVLLAGHVHVGRRANISGAAAAHHFVSIGEFAYVGGMTRMVQDVPPYMILEGHPSRVRQVNAVGLRRGGYSEEDVAVLSAVFRRIYRSDEPRTAVLDELNEEGIKHELVSHLVQSLENTQKGAKGRYRETLRESFAKLGAERLGSGARS